MCTRERLITAFSFYNTGMGNKQPEAKKLLRELNQKLKVLQAELAVVQKREGKDSYIEVKVIKNQARFQKMADKTVGERVVGKFFMEIAITAKQQDIFVPISIASGKKAAGFMYQIEGTAPGQIDTTECKVRGTGVSQVTVGTLLFAKIPLGKTASFQLQAAIGGVRGKQYKIVITRLNYKLHLSDARYQQYLKEIHSDTVIF